MTYYTHTKPITAPVNIKPTKKIKMGSVTNNSKTSDTNPIIVVKTLLTDAKKPVKPSKLSPP